MMHQRIDGLFHVTRPADAVAGEWRWFCIAVRPGYMGLAKDGDEYDIARRLRLAGFEAFVPQFVRTVVARHSRKKVERRVPMFRGYAFVRALHPLVVPDWRAILDTEGVHRLLGTHSGPSPMRAGFVEALIEAGPVRQQEGPKAFRWKKRMVARITAGSFAGIIGEVARADSDRRIVIMFRMLGADREVTLPVSVIEPVEIR